MKSENTIRESQRINELVTEYKNKGYIVSIPDSRNELPDFLREESYIPDIIAKSDKESLVIEVKSRKTVGDLARLSEVAEKVNSKLGWQFVLVFTNPRDRQSESLKPSLAKANELLLKSNILGHSTEAHIEASFLFTWSAIEALLRLISSEQKAAGAYTSVATLVRDAAMLGYIGRKDAKHLEDLLKLRSSILHAGDYSSLKIKDLDIVKSIANELLLQVNENKV